MAEQDFPRQNLNSAAAPWGRRVEKLILDALTRLETIESGLSGTQTTAVRALRKLGANPLIYRDEGIVAYPGSEFAVYTGEQADDGGTFGQDTPGRFSSLNVLPDKAALRHTNDEGGTAYVLAFETNVVSADRQRYQAVGGVAIGTGRGLRYDNFADGVRALEFFEDANGMPFVRLAAREAPLLTLGYENPVANGHGGYDQRPYMQWANDEDHRIYGFSDLAGAVPAGDESQAGRVRFATDAETVTGTIAGKATTPRGVKKAIAAALEGYSQKTPLDYWRGEWVQP